MTPDNVPIPNAAEYLDRIRALRDKNDHKGALEECHSGLEVLPGSPDLLLVYGEVRMDMFNLTKNTEHLKPALISFEKLLRISPRHYMGNLLAARIYLKGKAYTRAEEKLASILQISPNDPRALELKTALQKAKSQAREVAAEVADEEVVARGGTEPIPDTKNEEHENLINRLSIFSRLDGVRSLHLVDLSGTDIKSVVKSGKPLQGLSAHAVEIFKASAQCTRNASLGNFQRGVILTPDGDIMFVNVFYAALVLVLEPGTDIKAVESRVNRYVETIVG